MADTRLTARQFQEAGGTQDWRVLGDGISGWFEAPSHAVGASLLRSIVGLVGDGARQPDVDLRRSGVRVRLPFDGGLHGADVACVRAISELARGLGLRPDPAAVQSVRLAIDAVDKPAVLPFWRIVCGYEESGDELTDALRRDPAIWFQQSDHLRPLRNRFHVDVNARRPFTPDQFAALEGFGAREALRADYYLIAADAEGNEACLPVGPPGALPGGAETGDWFEMGCAVTSYPTASFALSADLAAAVAGLADEAGKALMIDVRPGSVTLDSGKDQQEREDFEYDEDFLRLARQAQAAARELGLEADPSPPVRFLQLAIDAVDVAAVRAFWMAVLRYEQGPFRRLAQDIYDPRRLGPLFWFQQITPDAADEHHDARLAQRNRIHIDLFVPHDQAQSRIDAALAAGGRLTSAAGAANRWTIADPEGNEVDIWAEPPAADLHG